MKIKKLSEKKKEEELKKTWVQRGILALSLVVFGIMIWQYGILTAPDPAKQAELNDDTIIEAPDGDKDSIIATSTRQMVIGTSTEGRIIESYTYGTGSTTVLFVGGIHGGYEWNSVLLAYELIDELEADMINVPNDLKIKIIPVLNPDGLYSVVGKEGRFDLTDIPPSSSLTLGQGRFNANNVDLNRNFDCKWQPESTWRGNKVNAGISAFSEPEALALKELVEKDNPVAVIFWHSKANAVYASECENGVLPSTITLMNTYASAASYKAVAAFDAYPVTGDAEGWLASIGIPAITVELNTRDQIEWGQNKAGVLSVLELYSNSSIQ